MSVCDGYAYGYSINIIGTVPPEIGLLGCIVNLAGNPQLVYGSDVPLSERIALQELYTHTKGHRWNNRYH